MRMKKMRMKEIQKRRKITSFGAVALMVLLILGVALILSSPPASARFYNRTWTLTGGQLNYAGGFASGGDPEDENAENISLVYNWKSGDESGGEKITFFNLEKGANASVTIEGPYTKSGNQYSGYELEKDQVKAGEAWNVEGKKADGYYRVTDDEDPKIGGWLQVVMQTFDLELEKKKVREGTGFNLTMKSNGRFGGAMKLTIEDSDGYSIMNAAGEDIYEILVGYTNKNDFLGFAEGQNPIGGIDFKDKKLAFNLSGLNMKAGKYTIIVEDYATSAKEKKDVTVEKRYLDVACDPAVVKGKELVLFITSSFYEEGATVTINDMKSTYKLDEEGKKKVKISTADLEYKTYKITVSVSDLKETRYVTIQREASSLDVPDYATIGEIVQLKGTSDFGDFALIVIDNVLKHVARISDDTFAWDWDTSGELDGYREIEIFIVNTHGFSIGEYISEDWQRENGVDASASIFLQAPTLSLNALDRIAKGDEVLISGTATGTDHIYLLIFNSRGAIVFPPGGLAKATPVIEGVWEEEITGLDTGRYVVIVLHKGRDGETAAIRNGKWDAGDPSKSLDQRIALVEYAIQRVDSDDIFSKDDFKVVQPEVKLELEDVIVGDELVIRAMTNVKDGTRAWIRLEKKDTGRREVREVRVNEGEIQAEFDTTSLSVGSWNVSVTIPDRCSDEGVVTIHAPNAVPAPEATPAPSATSSSASPARSLAAAEGSESRTHVLSGFELMSSFAVLMALAYLGRRRRYRTTKR